MTDLWADPDFVLDEMRDNGEARREPRPGDPIYLYGDRRTVLAFEDGRVLAHDDAGFALSRARSSLWWDGSAWRTFADPAR